MQTLAGYFFKDKIVQLFFVRSYIDSSKRFFVIDDFWWENIQELEEDIESNSLLVNKL